MISKLILISKLRQKFSFLTANIEIEIRCVQNRQYSSASSHTSALYRQFPLENTRPKIGHNFADA